MEGKKESKKSKDELTGQNHRGWEQFGRESTETLESDSFCAAMMGKHIVFILMLSAVVTRGFVTYVEQGNTLRWHLETGTYDSNLVNPNTKAIRYYIATDAFSAANREAEINAARACFDQWQAVSGTSLKFEFAGLAPAGSDVGQDGSNVVFWAKQSLMVNSNTVSISGKRGNTTVFFDSTNNKILEADIVLNAVQFGWFTDINHTANQAQFVESVLLHEVGHLVGLDHTPAGGATVVNGPNGIGTQAGLSADEIAAVRHLYPAGLALGKIQGRVTVNGSGVHGAMVVAEDSNGNIAGATVTGVTGDYNIHSLAAGTYQVRVSPFDPSGEPNNQSLMRAGEIAGDYNNALTSFEATANVGVSVAAGQTALRDFTVIGGGPAFRITSISRPTTLPDLVTIDRFASQIRRGQSGLYIGVNSPNLPERAVLMVSGDGITMGPSVYKPNRFSGLHAITAPISVSANATPGLRTLYVTHNGKVAYANGFLEVVPELMDFNFDGLEDKFQRQYFPIFTAAEAAPWADPDGDRFSNEFEYRTGSNPINAASYNFVIQSVRATATNAVVSWKSEAGRRYQLYARDAFAPDKAWYLAGVPVTASGPVTEAVLGFGRGGAGGARFYRLELSP